MSLPIRNSLLLRTQQTIDRLSERRAEVARAERQALTGERIARPSDDAAALPELHQVQASLSRQSTYKAGADRVASLRDTADRSLGQAEDLLTRAREIAVQASSETMTVQDRQVMGREVTQIYQQLVSVGNVEVGGRHLFGGTASDAPPFSSIGVYQGDHASSRVLVAPGVEIDATIDGSLAFSPALDALADLSVALNGGDADQVHATLGDLEAAGRRFNGARIDAGLDYQAADRARSVVTSVQENLATRLDAIAGVDPIESYTRLVEMRTAYEAAVKVAGSSQSTSLFDLMR